MTGKQQGVRFETLKKWELGIKNFDLKMVKEALDAGIKPDTLIEGYNPLHFLLRVNPQDADDLEIYQKKSSIVDTMLEHGLSLIAVNQEAKKEVVSQFLYYPDTILVSKLVLNALKQWVAADKEMRGFCLKSVMNEMKTEFEAFDDDDPQALGNARFAFLQNMTALEDIHGYVRAVLNDPSNKEDNDFVENNKDKLSYWLSDFISMSEKEIEREFPVDEKELRELDLADFNRENGTSHQLGSNDNDSDTSNSDRFITFEDESPEDVLKDIDALVGLDKFKEGMHALCVSVRYAESRKAKGLETGEAEYHTAFLGNPGTGKTTCSLLKARLLHSLGLVGPRYAELSRDTIIKGFIGQSEENLQNIMANTDTLFIDEAYSLYDGRDDSGDFGQKIIDGLIGELGRENVSITLFLAGYTDRMKDLISSNEGFSSRIKSFPELEDYTPEQIVEILEKKIEGRYTLTSEVKAYVSECIKQEKNEKGAKHFGNARVVDTFVGELPRQIALRLSKQDATFESFNAAALSEITKDDVKKVFAAHKLDLQNEPENSREVGFHTVPGVQ